MIRARITRDFMGGAVHLLEKGTLVEFTGEGLYFSDGGEPRPQVRTVTDSDGDTLFQYVTEEDYRLIL